MTTASAQTMETGAQVSAQTRTLRLEEFFKGEARGWGMVQDLFGKVRRTFEIRMHGEWSGDQFDLTEDFLFDDGKRERRVWHVRPTGDTGYVATANDVLSTAKGTCDGRTVRMAYDFGLKLGERTLKVRLSDLFVQVDEGVVLNRSDITKFGVKLGTITVTFRRD